MKCKFFAKPGIESKLYQDLNKKYGEVIAQDTWAYTKTLNFKNLNLPVNANGEVAIDDLEKNNLIINFSLLKRDKETKKNFILKAEQLKKAFKNINIEIIENTNLESTSVLKNINGKPVIEYNPEKIRIDSVYHEFGHLLIDLVGYESTPVQKAVEEIRGTPIYNTIAILNPWMTQEQLDKEALTTRIGIESSIKDSSRLKFLVNTLIRKIKELLGISDTAVTKLVNQLISKNITDKLQGKLSIYEQHQEDIRIINNIFVNKKQVLENSIIKIEQKLRDYFGNLEPEQRYGNPIYRDFTNISNTLKELKDSDINKGIIEFLSFAFAQTQLLETKIDAIINPDRISERPEVDATFLRDLLNYNEAFGDIMEDLESVINSNYLLKQELKDYKPRFDESILNYIPKIKERYNKVKREGKKLSLEYVADLMLKTGDNNKFVEHLKNSLKRQWVELPGNKDLILKDRKEGEKLQQEWADTQINNLKKWGNDNEMQAMEDGTERIVAPGGRTLLEETVRKYYLGLLQQTSNDIGWYERWLLAGNMINDEIIQYGNELLDKADYNTRIEVTEEFRKSFDLFDRYTKEHGDSNQVKKYDPLIENEVELNDDSSLPFTGKKRPNLVSKYYSKFFDYKSAKLKELAEVRNEFGENSKEYENKWKKYQQWLDDNTIRPYNEEYYKNLESLPEFVKQVVKPLKAKKRSILQRYSVTAKNNVFNLTDITEDDADALKNLEKQLKELSSKYTKQGELKTGNALNVAEELTKYNELMNSMYDEGEFQAHAFGVARGRAKRAGKEEEFMEKNTYIGIKKEFWEDLQASFVTNIQDAGKRKEIQSLLKNFKASDGTILVDELDDEATEILKKMYESVNSGGLVAKEWFKKNVLIEIRPEYTRKVEDMRESLEEGSITQEQYDSWFEKNHTKDKKGRLKPLAFWTKLSPATNKYKETKYNKYWYTTKVKEEFENKNLKEGEEIGGLKAKWLNPQYTALQNKGGVTKEMYDFLINRIEEDDKPLYNDYKLVMTDEIGNKYYKLPAVIKHSNIEILGDEGIVGLFKNKYHRAVNALKGKKEDSADFGGDVLEALYTESNNVLLIQADEQGRERHRVPVNLRTPIAVEDQSFDLMSVALLNFHMSKNFQNKQEIAHKLELMGDLLSERNVIESQHIMLKGTKIKINNLLGAVGLGLLPVNKKGESSNSYLAFKSMLESRLYGLKSKGSVTAHQITSLLTRYTGSTALALNIFSAGANLVSGKLQNYILASGSQFINYKDIAFVKLELNKQIPNLIADTARSVPQSKIGRLIEKLNPKSDWDPLSKKFSMDSNLKRIFGSIDLNILNSTGETVIQSTLMLAVLNNAKALSKNGLYLDSEFNETSDINKAISMYDAYNSNSKEMATPNENVGGFTINEKLVVDKDFEFYLSFFIRELNKSLQGDYDEQSISEARRNVIGKLALVLRRWYPATLSRRVRGFTSVLKNSAELDADESYYNRATRNEEEGYYTTFTRYLYQITKEAKRLKFEQGRSAGQAILESIKTGNARLLNYERANLHQTFGEMAATGLYLALSTVLYKLGKDIPDDEKIAKNSTYMLAFWIIRAQRELTAYYNPYEIQRLANTPSVVLKQVKEVLDVFSALGSEILHQADEPFSLRRYERTRRKGQSKTWKEITDIVPIFRQLDKQIDEQLSYMTNVKGF